MSEFASIIADALCSLSGVAGQTVTFVRNTDWVKVEAVSGSTTFDLDDGNGVVVEYRTQDWLIGACNLRIAGEQVEPKRGDLIEQSVGSRIHVFEVLRPDGGEQVFRYIDPARTRMRVHTKLKEIVNR